MTEIDVPDWVVEAAEDARVHRLNAVTAYGSAGVDERYHMAMRAALTAALGAWVVPVAWGVQYDLEGTGKSEVRDLRFTKDSAEGAAFAAQCSIPPGFPIKVSAQPLYTLRQEKLE